MFNSQRKSWFSNYLRSKDVFFIESPFQLICMQSFIKQNSFVFFRPTSESSRQQIIELMKYFTLENKFYFLLLFSNSKLGKLKDISFVCLLFLINASSNWHLGYFRAKVSKFILYFFPTKGLIYYDDGMATVNIVNEDLLLRYKNIRFRTIFYKSLNKFPRVEFNDVNAFDNITHYSTKYDNCNVFFGTKLVEGEFITLDEYTSFVNDSIHRFNVNLYLAHRDETDSKLDCIRELGIKVVKLELPIEIAIKIKLLTPKIMTGAVTSSLLTTKLLFGGDVYYYSVVNMTKRRKERLINTEKTFDENGVTKVSL